jgi:apolipoprotein N-acyltransferase
MSYLAAVIHWLDLHSRTTAVLIGFCIGASFVVPTLFLLAPIGFIFLWRFISRTPLLSLPAALGMVFGVKALMSLSWFWSTIPITWLPEVSLPIQFIAIFLYWSSSALWLASAGVILALLIALLRRGPRPLMVVGLPIAIVGSEYLGAVVFSIFTYGPGSFVSGGFSYGHSGYAFPWLFPLAQWGSVYLVGLFGLLIISLLYHWYDEQPRRKVYGYCLLLFVGVFSYAFVSLPQTTVTATIALVQTDSQPRDRISDLAPLVAAAFATNPDYVLLPEDSRYFTEGYEVSMVGVENAIGAWRILHASSSALIVDSGRSYKEGTLGAVQRAYLWDTKNMYTTDKVYLAPQGEYMPILYALALRAAGLGAVADNLQSTINYVSGTATIDETAPASVPNILFCFENVNPLAAKRLITKRPSDFIVHPISHSWFHEPYVLWTQFDTMLRFQAVHAGVPIVSVGNDVRGSLYLPDGTIIAPQTVATLPEGTVDMITLPPRIP